ncbi:hypothetical protein [Halobacillus salinus]|uniref:hypothetical protein n=1 Tax=Halobacillus salinus TaxID=192814 RepID=UPI001590FF2C|nr:hypothetical protein [Halobacillus salinus]
MKDIVLTIAMVLLVVVGWGAVIMRDFEIAKGQMKGKWVHVVASIICFILIVWIAREFM